MKNINDEIENIAPDENAFYSLLDFSKALEFTLISEGFLHNDTLVDDASILKVRLTTILHSEVGNYFDGTKHYTNTEFIDALKVTKGVAIIPIGCLEKHGYHMPLGTDMFIAKELAEKAEMSSRYLKEIENGGRVPSFHKIRKLVRALNVPPEPLFYPNNHTDNLDYQRLLMYLSKCNDEQITAILAIVEAYLRTYKIPTDHDKQDP